MRAKTGAALAAASITIGLTTGCGALGAAPITNARANDNPAIEQVNYYRDAPRERPRSETPEKRADRKTADRAAGEVLVENRWRPVGPRRTGAAARRDPVGTRNDMRPIRDTSGKPAWRTALDWAQTKKGVQYVWGGESMAEGGYDCSGLTQTAYAHAGIALPRLAHHQYHAGDVHPKKSDLKPGDLVFYGTKANLHHVGMYIGDGKMIHAPNSRSKVRIDKLTYMKDYYGATRVVR